MGLATEYASLVKSMQEKDNNPLYDILKGFETGSKIGKQMADTQSKQAEMKMAEILFPLEYQSSLNKVKATELQISKAALGLKEQEKKIDYDDELSLGQAKAVEMFDNTLTTEGDYDYNIIANMSPPTGMTPAQVKGWRNTQKEYLGTLKGQLYANEVKNIEALNAENELLALRQDATIKNILLKKGMEFTPENADAVKKELIRQGQLEQQLDERRKIADVRVLEAKGEKLKSSSTKTKKLPRPALTSMKKITDSLNKLAETDPTKEGSLDAGKDRDTLVSNLDSLELTLRNEGYDTEGMAGLYESADELVGLKELHKSTSTRKKEIETELKEEKDAFSFWRDDEKISKLESELASLEEAENEYTDRIKELKDNLVKPLKALVGAPTSELKPSIGTGKSQADVVSELADELSEQVEIGTGEKKSSKVKFEDLPKQYQNAVRWLESNPDDPNSYKVRKKINDYLSSLEK